MTTTPKTEEVPLDSGKSELPALAQKAVAACRKGKYKEALDDLEEVLAAYKDTGKIPARLLSYYGVCLAEVKGKVADGLEFCKTSISKDRFHADHYANLARVYIVGKARKKAIDALKKASTFDGDNTLAGDLWKEIGKRKSPPVGFLRRDHPLNVIIGRVRRKK